MRGDGTPLVPASGSRARISLPPSGQIEFTLNEDSDELLALGQVRMGFLVTSVDRETQLFLPSAIQEVALDTRPSDLLRKVWLARSGEERKEIQPLFNQFLKAIELSESNDEQEFYRARERERAYLTRTLNCMGGYAIPFMEMAARDSDAKTRALAVTYFARSVAAIDQLKALLRSEDPLKETRDLIASHWIEWNGADVDPLLVFVNALRDTVPEVRTAAVKALAHREAEEIRIPEGDITSRRPDQPYFQDF
jgi:hypothetical protein